MLLGAGRSSSALIRYLLENASKEDWILTVADQYVDHLPAHDYLIPQREDIGNPLLLAALVASHDIIISLLPPSLHVQVAEIALEEGKSMLTASYIPAELLAKSEDWKAKGLLFLGECGLDPGIDHMSTMNIKHQIESKGGRITAYSSYTGGLVAPESDNNPWHYKISWNPANVVRAGQGTAVYRAEGKEKRVPYHRLFEQLVPIYIPNLGEYEGYLNRDSIKYQPLYGMEGVPYFVRGTIRGEGFCSAWNLLVQLGLTEDGYTFNTTGMQYRDFLQMFLPIGFEPTLVSVAHYLQLEENDERLQKLEWLGLFSEEKLKSRVASPAVVLQEIIESKWVLKPEDKDLVIMVHRFEYELEGRGHLLESQLVVKGEDAVYTAMAKTVGLPIGIATKHILNGNITTLGVALPLSADIYELALKELAEEGIVFSEVEKAF